MVKTVITQTANTEPLPHAEGKSESSGTLAIKSVQHKLNRSESFVECRPSGVTQKIKPQRQNSIDGTFVSTVSQGANKDMIQVQVVGKSHLVQIDNHSLVKGKLEREVSAQDLLTIDVSRAVTSRRGPNQEIFDQIDLRSPPMYNWYPVEKINGEAVSENWFVREDAFVNDKDGRVMAETPQLQAGKRGRPQARQPFDFPEPPKLVGKRLDAKYIDDYITKLDLGTEPIDVKEEIKKFTNLLSGVYGGSWMSILYGSYASGNQRASTDQQPGSDIDVMFSCDNQSYAAHREELIPKITQCIAALHKRVGAVVDDEVPADSKHLISADEMMEAASLNMYYPTNTEGLANKVHIDPLRFFLDKEVSLEGITKSESERFSPEFLQSKYLRLRLLFNIMTTPNVIHSNNKEAIKILEDKVKHVLSNLLQDLINQLSESKELSIDQKIELLLGQGENKGEYWLGYKQDRKGVVEKLKSLLTSND
ncbi:hypothetical protein GCM10007938_07240 [Vibrio zhanjiangensis]|uniref:Polymerase nucleotidyl transferase domain-containing protein n=1 Tax=Vibrio zhanjiangensis TaxID=1046128 RepID=A0ABQ6EWP2_9VIBR|nr:nucleotidyltransferase domain-containing protein [Vibrio zhanjiangensis]GLT16947.1 hypothetical protein GCM10007938_07240 [Vibrio zhanjiangensis]